MSECGDCEIRCVTTNVCSVEEDIRADEREKVLEEFIREIKRLYFDNRTVIRCCEIVANSIKK